MEFLKYQLKLECLSINRRSVYILFKMNNDIIFGILPTLLFSIVTISQSLHLKFMRLKTTLKQLSSLSVLECSP